MRLDAEMAAQVQDLAVKQLADLATARAVPGREDKVDPQGVVPAELVRFLARLRLLEGVPFNYLVPDADLLPLETIRFFHVDRNWLDALVQGALSVGTVNSGDREQLAALHALIRREVDTAERLVRMKDADAPAVDAAGRPVGAAGAITGFLLRSRLVSGWPGMHVRAYATDNHDDRAPVADADADPQRLRLLRMERLAPAVLLVLFDGVPAVVHLEEPRSGIQFGVRVRPGVAGMSGAVVPLRDVLHPNEGFLQLGNADRTVRVPFRKGAPGVINMRHLGSRLRGVAETNINADGKLDSAEYALEMLRFPIRQVFGDTAVDAQHDDFRATLTTARLAERFTLAQRALAGGDGGGNG
jgi:hypothetical protein